MKITGGFIIIVLLIVGGTFILARENSGGGNKIPQTNNSQIVGGKQIVNIRAKGGYSPIVSAVRANTETILRIETNNTFDCSSAVTIPALNYRANLPMSGIAEIFIPPQNSGTILQGLCAMGMYKFQLRFN